MKTLANPTAGDSAAPEGKRRDLLLFARVKEAFGANMHGK